MKNNTDLNNNDQPGDEIDIKSLFKTIQIYLHFILYKMT